ncbi:hypothetical protein OXX80_010906 [Metschnikowia pulcherrima]
MKIGLTPKIKLFLVTTSIIAFVITGSADAKYTHTHINKRVVEEPQKEAILVLTDRLQKFVGVLQSLAHVSGFESLAFEWRAGELHHQINNLENMVGRLDTPNLELANMLMYAKHMMHVMTTAAKTMRFYGQSDAEEHLLRSVVQLNVRLMALHDSNGNPVVERHDIREEISISSHYLKFWRHVFNNQVNVSPCLQIMFEIHCNEAENTLRMIANALNVSERNKNEWQHE